MSIERSNSLSPKVFAKMVTGDKTYLPSKIRKELDSAGLKQGSGRITRQKAMKALRHLKNKKMLHRAYMPSDLVNHATKVQYDQDLETKKLKVQKHIKANIMLDIQDEYSSPKYRKKILDYNPHSVLGKSVYAVISEEKKRRETTIEDYKKKKEKISGAQARKIKKPENLGLREMFDMEIG